MKRIFIVEDEISVARNIEKILSHSGYKIIGIATSYRMAKEKIVGNIPDLILCDINLNSGKDEIELMIELNKQYHIPYIFLSEYSCLDLLKEMSKASPYAFIVKPFHDKQLLASVNSFFASLDNRDAAIPTEKERSVLQLIARGFATKEIAHELSLSFHTIESHRKNLMNKYKVKSMPELICMATQKGWIEYSNE